MKDTIEYKAGDEVTLELTGVSSEAAAVGHVGRLAVFVAGALPDEQVRAVLTRCRKNYAEARLLEVLRPSPARIRQSCPAWERCGGCQLLHCEYSRQLELKTQIVQQTLTRIGGLGPNVPVQRTIGSPQVFHYRDRAVLHVNRDEQGGIKLGFFARKSHSAADSSGCLLLREPLVQLMQTAEELLNERSEAADGLRHVLLRCSADASRMLLAFVCERPLPKLAALAQELQTREPRLASVWQCSGAAVYGVYGADWQKLAGEAEFYDSIGPLRLRISPASFLQVNSQMTPQMYGLVERLAGLSGSEEVLDIYSGVGGIGLWLAGRAGQVTSVESYAPAVEAARLNAALNGVDNIRCHCGAAETLLPKLAQTGRCFDCAVLDPPRSGCEPQLLAALTKIAPQRIVYVSCDPATLARDIKILSADGYRPAYVQPLDLFPQTRHVETVVLLSRKRSLLTIIAYV